MGYKVVSGEGVGGGEALVQRHSVQIKIGKRKKGAGNKRKIGSMFGNFQIRDAVLNVLKCRN